VKNDKIFELDPAIFLQPGPALFKDGIQILKSLIQSNS
jgi:iron complex transport system substrate-binding protein